MKTFIIIPCFLALLFFTEIAISMDINVTKFEDTLDSMCDSDCSLREAIHLANANPGIDRIFLQEGKYIVNLYPIQAPYNNPNSSGSLYITDDVIIEGARSGPTIVDGEKKFRMLVNTANSTHLLRLTFTNGNVEYISDGSAIINMGGLTLTHCVIKNNFTPRGAGAIANYGELSIYSSLISDNYSGVRGGGLFNNRQATLTIRDTTFQGNSVASQHHLGTGGGLYNEGKADIRRSLFRENSIPLRGFGAAIMNALEGELKLTSTTISGHVSGSHFWGGGAVANGAEPWPAGGKLYLNQVTITNNAHFGLFSNGYTTIKNSIIAGNARPEDGLAQNCLVAGGEFHATGLLLGRGDNPNCYSDLLPLDNNQTFITLLKPLADNGGPTFTHALRKNSLAIDTGGSSCPEFDQRGLSAPLDGDADGFNACDIGAVEYQP